ncbi:MAG: potassium transporter KefB, partial [Bacteroidetes bacterium]
MVENRVGTLQLFSDIVIILALSVLVVLLCHRLRIASIVGFLITGALAGPHGFGLVHAEHEVEVLAEIGVILLLFTIGMEFSVTSLKQVKRVVLLG